MKSVLDFIKGPVFFRYWLMIGFFPFTAVCYYMAYQYSFAYFIGLAIFWTLWHVELSTGICLSCKHYGSMHCFPQGPLLKKMFKPRSGPVPKYRAIVHELMNLSLILIVQIPLWQKPAIAVVANIWIALAIAAGIPYRGASWLKNKDEWEGESIH